MLCKGTDNLPYTIRPSQESVQQPSTRSVFRPVLVDEVTSTTSRRDQYCLLWVTSTSPIADQYWSHLPPAAHSEEIAPKKALLIRGNSPYYNDYPPSREGSVSPLTEEGEMPHRTSLIAQPILVGGLTYIGSHRDQYRYILSTYIGQPADQYRCTPPLTEEGQTALYDTAIYPQQERQRDHLQRARQTALRHPPKWAERCFFSIIF